MTHHPKPWKRTRRGKTLWYVQFDGKQHFLGYEKEQALSNYYQMMSERTQKPRQHTSSSLSVKDIMEAYLDWCEKNRSPLTYSWYLNFCHSFDESIPKGLLVSDLKPFHVQQWVDDRNDPSASTKRACITVVKRVFSWAEKSGYIERSPLAHLQRPPEARRERIISQSELDTILSHIPDDAFHDLLTVAWNIGPRPQEIVRVEARHVDLENARWVFPKEESKIKTHPRIIYLTDQVLLITKKLMLKNPEGFLFLNNRGKPWNKSSVNSRFCRLQKKLGKKYCLYLFRHSFATRLLESGVDSLTVALLLGHQNPGTLAKVYQHLSFNPKHMLEQLKKSVG